MGKLIRAPWWWPDPWDMVPRVEDRISPYSGVPPQLPPLEQRARIPPKGDLKPSLTRTKLDGGGGVALVTYGPRQGKAGGLMPPVTLVTCGDGWQAHRISQQASTDTPPWEHRPPPRFPQTPAVPARAVA